MTENMQHQKVLLETGTNEVEILEFYLGEQSFGINVSKVLQLVAYDDDFYTPTPEAPVEAPGVYLWRDDTIPLVDLKAALNTSARNKPERPIMLVTEFNSVINGFHVDGVNRIHRLSWEQIDPASVYLERYSARITGSVHVEGRDILLPDFEQIVAELSPDTKLSYSSLDMPQEGDALKREHVKVLVAEDSQFIRVNMIKLLAQAGYNQIREFENGKDALKYITETVNTLADEGRPVSEAFDIVISDIEMPQLDGLTLCKRIKDDPRTQDTPVIIFSSLINEQMIHKCKEVGADDHVTKPRMGQLVSMLDRLLGIE